MLSLKSANRVVCLFRLLKHKVKPQGGTSAALPPKGQGKNISPFNSFNLYYSLPNPKATVIVRAILNSYLWEGGNNHFDSYLLVAQLQLMPNSLCRIGLVHAVEMQARGSLVEQGFGQLRANLLTKSAQRSNIVTKIL